MVTIFPCGSELIGEPEESGRLDDAVQCRVLGEDGPRIEEIAFLVSSFSLIGINDNNKFSADKRGDIKEDSRDVNDEKGEDAEHEGAHRFLFQFGDRRLGRVDAHRLLFLVASSHRWPLNSYCCPFQLVLDAAAAVAT